MTYARKIKSRSARGRVVRAVAKSTKGGKVTSESLGDYSVNFGDIEDDASYLGVNNILNMHKDFVL